MDEAAIKDAILYCSILDGYGDYDLIIEKAREVLSELPTHRLALVFLCHAQHSLGLYEELRETAQFAIKHHPQRASFYHYLYIYYLYVGGEKYIEALRAIREAIRLSPENAIYYSELGEVYLINWEPEKARQALREAYRLKPNDAIIMSRLGLAELRCGNMDEAFNLARSALARFSDKAWVYNNVGQIYLFSGNLDEAEEHLHQAVQKCPKDEYFQRQLLTCKKEQENKKQRLSQGLEYVPLVRRQKGTKRFFDEEVGS